MKHVERLLTFLFDRFLPGLLGSGFLVVMLAPGLAAYLVDFTSTPQFQTSASPLWYVLRRIDSGFQLGLGSYLARGWVLALGMLLLLLGTRPPAPCRALFLAVLAFHAWASFSSGICSHPFDAFLTTLDSGLLLLVAWLACVYGATQPHLPRVLVISGGLVALFSLNLYLLMGPTSDSRLSGTFHQPNMTSAYLACLLPWLIHQEILSARAWKKIPGYLVLGLLMLCLLLAATRTAGVLCLACLCWRWSLGYFLKKSPLSFSTALLSLVPPGLFVLSLFLALFDFRLLALTLALLVVLAWKGGVGRGHILCIGLLFMLVRWGAMPSLQASVGQNLDVVTRVADLGEGEDSSLLARLEFFRSSLLMGLEHPWTGVGPKGFHRYYPSFQVDERWFSKFAHSSILSCWAEVGIPGVVLLAFVLGCWGWHLLRGLRQSDPIRRTRVLDAFISALILGLASAFDVQWQFPLLPITWAVWLGYVVSQSWAEDELFPEQPAQVVGAWTIRPRVVLSYFGVSVLGILSALNLLWMFAQYHADLGEMALQRGKIEEAIFLDRRAVVLNPFQGSYHHHLGLSLLAGLAQNLKEVKAADIVDTARRAVELDSHRAVHYDLLAKGWNAAKEPEKARAAVLQALQCDSINYPSFYNHLAEYHLSQSASPDPRRAERILETCVARFPAEAFGAMFNFRSSEMNRQLSESYLVLAELASPQNHPARSLVYLEKLLKLNPSHAEARFGRLVCLVNLNRLDEAKKEALEEYRKAPSPNMEEVLRVIYHYQNIPVGPQDFPTSTPPPAHQPPVRPPQ